ncbi:thiol:disulfide interchange protein DsbD [Campylobacter blaseri]|uniref:Thioredoxin domain-containing protein n=1 Tax=Campylobacter blaseri TaxID=2042961 RepID=A0A2P8R243_9BACT|nr:protein-disulfide reductase DsbD [Campylobacter blaseri]PSM52565.1 hypothetical protein CQ405_02220 [Campylobacter blaseri]PSM54213.1 hypothetical protein CRN67_02220 [Campylobacter blaseri]QKF85864.1 thiol:disulfide interchange protein DsbD [Campylobacter blaseri]
MRFFIAFLLFFTILNAEGLSTADAFKVEALVNKKDGVVFKFDIDDSVYLYKDRLKVAVGDNDITDMLSLPKITEYKSHKVFEGDFNLTIPSGLILSSGNLDDFKINLSFMGCAYSGACYSPQNYIYEFKYDANKYSIAKTEKKVSSKTEEKIVVSEQDSINEYIQNSGFLAVLATFFGYGLLLALTPCVFPMIPILSSILVAKCEKNNTKKSFFISFIYVFFMSLAYAIAGVIASFFGASVQGMLQIPWVIILFSLIFVALAFNMFGFYEITLPSKLENVINKKSESKKGYIGVAIMGFLSALIVGPCVAAPLAGALLYIANTGDALLGGLSLFIMSFGMGVPLLLIGLGANKILPKPGFWMDEVKKIFGFIMLFMAVWMFSRVISANLTMFLYGVLGVMFASFFGVFDKIENGLNTGFLKFKKGISFVILIYSVLLIIGYSLGGTNPFKPLENFSASSNIQTLPQQSNNAKPNFTKVSNMQELDNIINNSTKPIIIDFWATWCVVCKELDVVIESSEIQDILKDFELVKIDVTNSTLDDKELMKRFNVFGPPALIFFKDGKEIKNEQLVGFMDKANLSDKLKRVLEY